MERWLFDHGEESVAVTLIRASAIWKLYEALLAHPPLARLWLHLTLLHPSPGLMQWLDAYVVRQPPRRRGRKMQEEEKSEGETGSEQSVLRLWQRHVER